MARSPTQQRGALANGQPNGCAGAVPRLTFGLLRTSRSCNCSAARSTSVLAKRR